MHVRNYLTLLLCGLWLSSNAVPAQELGSWKVYSSYNTINDITSSSDGSTYVGTLGGLFKVEQDEITGEYSTIDGLYRLDPSHLVYDENNDQLVLAYSDGMINIFNPSTELFIRVDDIFRVEQFNSKRINDLLIHDDQLFVATDFGVVIFDLQELLVQNSYLSLGAFSRGVSVNDIDIENDMIFCATAEGVAVGNLNDNLLESSSWASYSEDDGFGAEIVTSVVSFDGEDYAVSEGQTYILNAGNWSVTSVLGSGSVIEFNKTGDKLISLFSNKLTVLDINSSLTQISFESDVTGRSIHYTGNNLLVGSLFSGLIEIDESSGAEVQRIFPDGPFLNIFNQLEFTPNGLISTSQEGFPRSGDPFYRVKGYYFLKDGQWQSFNRETSDELRSSGYRESFSVSATDNNFFIGSWGTGIARHNIETGEIDVYNSSNSGFTGVSGSRDFVVIPGVDNDSQNNVWATSLDSNVPLNLQMNGDDDWSHFSKVRISSSDLYFDIFIDSNDQKWISLIDISGNGRGLVIIDTNNPEDPSDDEFKKLTSGQNNGNLPDEKVKAFIQDKNGEVWIGTERGIARFIFTDFIVQSTNPNEYRSQWLINEDTSAVSRFLLRDVNVSAMAVNEANEKWIGSENQGIWVVNAEGSRIIKRFTAENSPLISNNINSITIDDETGEVFIATESGLVSYTDVAQSPVNSMDELKVYPNPFNYSRNSQIIIEGLSEATDIKILGVDGKIVNEFSAQGGRASWDGLDYMGNRLGTGVYIVVALESDGKEKGIGKVVIIK